MQSAGLRIGAATYEVLRKLSAEWVLGLPPDTHVDRDVALNKLTAS
jgi:hypothetical protein